MDDAFSEESGVTQICSQSLYDNLSSLFPIQLVRCHLQHSFLKGLRSMLSKISVTFKVAGLIEECLLCQALEKETVNRFSACIDNFSE